MEHLFGRAGLAALAALMARAPLLAFDFDGTLAPIVERPEDARLPDEVVHGLAALARRLPLAVVSGRCVEDLRPRLGFAPRYLVGNHGAEDDGASGAFAGELDEVRRRLIAAAPALAAAGVRVEDKGASIALHVRRAAHPDEALALAERVAGGGTLARWRVFGGKAVLNVVPAGAPDKAAAVRSLLARCGAGCAFFAGDDVNDEPVFADAAADWLTVQVGDHGLPSRAMFRIDGPHQTAAMLERMLAALGESSR